MLAPNSLKPLMAAFVVSATHCSHAGLTITQVSTNTSNAAVSSTAAGMSGGPLFSPDGRWLYFVSSASDLENQPSRGPWLSLFRKDLTSGAVESMTPHSTASSVPLAVSADGTRVLLINGNPGVPGFDWASSSQLFLLNTVERSISILSTNNVGAPGKGNTSFGVMTSDAGWIAFESAAAVGVAKDIASAKSIFVLNTRTGIRREIAADGTGFELVSLSDDGHYLAYRSGLTAAQMDEDGHYPTDLVVLDLLAYTKRRLTAPYIAPRDSSTIGTIGTDFSRDGRYLATRIGTAFTIPGSTFFNFGDVLWYDLVAGTNIVVYHGRSSQNDLFLSTESSGPVLSSSGRGVIFNALTTNLTNPIEIRIWRPETGSHSLAELARTVPPVSSKPEPWFPGEAQLSPDDTSVLFTACTGTNRASPRGVFLRHLATGRTTELSANRAGKSGNRSSGFPALSGDGRYVAFASDATNLVATDLNGFSDVFLADLETENISLAASPVPQLAPSPGDFASILGAGGLSHEGRRLVFTSANPGLVVNDTNTTVDVFLHDAETGATTLVSVGTNGFSPSMAASDPILSADGRVVVFSSRAPELAPGTNESPSSVATAYLFHRNLELGRTQCITHRFNGDTRGRSGGTSPSLSADGRYVVYLSTASDLVSNVPSTTGDHAFLYDAQTGANKLLAVDRPLGSSRSVIGPPRISDDGLTIAVLNVLNYSTPELSILYQFEPAP